MTQMPSHALPPASTTNYSVQSVGAALKARRASGSQRSPLVQEGRTGDIAKVAALYGAPVVPQAQTRSAPSAQPKRAMCLSELAAMVTRAKNRKKVVVESGDPDGPDTGGYDPQDIVKASSSSAAAAARVVGAMRRKR